MNRCYEIFENHTFRKSYANLRRSPINKSLFEIWSNLLASISEEEYAKLLDNKSEFLNSYINFLDDPDFIISISRDSMKHSSVRSRFENLNNLLKQYTS